MSDEEKIPKENIPGTEIKPFKKSGKLVYSNGSPADKLFLAEQVTDSLNRDSNEQAIMSTVGYNQEKILAFTKCYEAALKSYVDHQKETGDKLGYHVIFEEMFTKVKTELYHLVKVAQVALKREPVKLAALKMHGKKSISNSDLIIEMISFYTVIIEDRDLAAKLAAFGFGDDKINDNFMAVKKLQSFYNDYCRESQESKAATKFRDQKIAELDEWMSDYYKLYKVAHAINSDQTNPVVV